MSTGNSQVQTPVTCSTPVGYGQIQALYVSPSTYSNHPTQWKYNGTWFNVGTAVQQVQAGTYTVVFNALNAGDTDPQTRVVTVASQKLVKINISYT